MVVANAAGGVLPADEQILGGSDLETAHARTRLSGQYSGYARRAWSCVVTPLEFALNLRKPTTIAKGSVGASHSFELKQARCSAPLK